MASILKVDELRGIASAGDITITSEGGTATMQLQQGVAKCWVKFQGDAGTIAPSDSLNVGSLTDEGTGRYQINLSNSMNNSDHAVHISVAQGLTSVGDYIANFANIATGSFDIGQNTRSGSAVDSATSTASTFGDLA